MQLKTVIFDLDDTLYTDWDACHEAGLANVDAYGVAHLALEEGHMRKAFLQGRMRVFEQLAPTGSAHNRVLFAQSALESLGIAPIAHAQALHDAYWKGIFDTMQLEPAIPTLLHDLHTAGIQIAVCTNMMADIQMHKLRALGIAQDIDTLITSEEIGTDKPHSQIFHYVLQKTHTLASQAIMIGDNYDHDVCGAQAIGIDGIWISRKGHPVPDGGESPAYYTRNMEEVAQILRGLIN